MGDWLPEPIFTGAPPGAGERAELASDLSMAFLVLLEVVAQDATWTSDGGGKIPVAHDVRGAARIARFQTRLARKLLRRGLRFELEWINGEPALSTWAGERLVSTLSVDTDGERLTAFYAVLNPEKLRHARPPPAVR